MTITTTTRAPHEGRRRLTGKRLNGLLATALLGASSLPALAVEPFTANYQASYMGMSANGQMVLAAAGENRWRYSLDISNSLANLSQSTVFEERDGQWRPLSSKDSSKVLVKKQDKAATYNWSSGVASWTGDVKPERAGPIKLQAGDMDALLINLALVRDVAAGKPLNYRMVDDGRVKQLNYTVAGKESITVGGKPQQATKVVSTDGGKQTIAWVVAGMPVPARILQREDGKDALDLRVQSVR
ncbi:MAG: DUF3108 domain-containing protein [Pseudomonadota bacterium]|nr:DUF3108 domain-containing protein [Pseudomonadota bacterium]